MRTQAAEKTEAAAGKARTAPRQNRIPSAPGLCVSTQETFVRRQDNHGGPLSALFPWIFPMQPPQSRIRIYSDKILAIAPLSCDEEVIVHYFRLHNNLLLIDDTNLRRTRFASGPDAES